MLIVSKCSLVASPVDIPNPIRTPHTPVLAWNAVLHAHLIPFSQLALPILFPCRARRPRKRHAISRPRNMRQPDQLLQHRIPCPDHQAIHIRGRHALGRNRGQHADIDGAGVEYLLLHVQYVGVVCDGDGDDGDLGLDGEMEGTLLEGEQHGLFGIGACAFGEDEDVLAFGAHRLGGAIEGGTGGGAVGAVNEDGLGEGHCWRLETGRWWKKATY
jgi:hypothetical protein